MTTNFSEYFNAIAILNFLTTNGNLLTNYVYKDTSNMCTMLSLLEKCCSIIGLQSFTENLETYYI